LKLVTGYICMFNYYVIMQQIVYSLNIISDSSITCIHVLV